MNYLFCVFNREGMSFSSVEHELPADQCSAFFAGTLFAAANINLVNKSQIFASIGHYSIQ